MCLTGYRAEGLFKKSSHSFDLLLRKRVIPSFRLTSSMPI